MTAYHSPENGEDCNFRFDNPEDFCQPCYVRYVEEKDE